MEYCVIYPIYKNSDLKEYNNKYWGIVLLNVTYKIVVYCLIGGIKSIVERIIEVYQGSIRPNRFTIEQNIRD